MKRLISIVLLLVSCLAPVGQSAGHQPIFEHPIFGIEWSPDGASIALASFDGAWLYTADIFHQITEGFIDDIAWSPDGHFVVLLRHNRPNSMTTGQIEFWDVSSPTSPLLVRTITDEGMKGEDVENLDWSPISNLVAVSGVGIRIWNADTRILERTIQPDDFSSGVKWSPDGGSIVDFFGDVTIWNGLTGALQHLMRPALTAGWGSWGNDSQHIAIRQSEAGFYNEVHILDLSQPVPEASPVILSSNNSSLTEIDWKGNTIAGFSSNGIMVWDIRTQQLLPTVISNHSRFALSPDGSQIAYIQDGVLQIQTVNTPFVAPTPTATPVNHQELGTLQSLIADENCILPCWWGFQIGEGNLASAQSNLISYFGQAFSTYQDDTFTMAWRRFNIAPESEFEEDTTLSFRLIAGGENQLVAASIHFERPYESYLDLSSLMPAGILSTYGEPDEITIAYPLGPMKTSYTLSIRYYSQNFYIMYYISSFSTENSATLFICNKITAISEVYIWIQSEEISLPTLLKEELVWDVVRSRNTNTLIEWDIENITAFETLEDFTEFFSQENTCFYSLSYDEWVRSE